MKSNGMRIAILSMTAAWGVSGLAAQSPVLFQEDFRIYKDDVPGAVTNLGLRCSNDGAHLHAELVARPERDGEVYLKPLALPGGNRFDVYIRYKLLSPTSSFDVVFSDAAGKTTAVPVAYEDVRGAWQEVVLKGVGASVEIHHAVDRVFGKTGEAKVPANLTGVNFAVKANLPVSFDRWEIRRSGPIEGHPAARHFASFKSLGQKLANAKKGDGSSRMLFDAEWLGFRIVLGSDTNRTSSFSLVWNDGRVSKVTMKPTSVDWKVTRAFAKGPKKGETIRLSDWAIEFAGVNENGLGGRLVQYVRPYMRNYIPGRGLVDQGVDVIRERDTLPSASGHVLDVDFAKDGLGVTHLYVDGSWVTALKDKKTGATVSGVILTPANGVSYLVKEDRYREVDRSRFVPIDLSENPRAKAFADAKFAGDLKPGLMTVGGVPVDLAKPLDSADVGICREGAGMWALEVDEYHGRSPTWGFPSAVHYRLPAAPYARAHVVFAFDPDPSKDRVLVTRLARFRVNGIGDNLIGDTTLDFGKGLPEGVREIGKVKKDGKDVPLYFMTIPLNVGKINDLVVANVPNRNDFAAGGDYLDFEFTGKSGENLEQEDNTSRPDPLSTSAFNIFAVTLEKAIVTVDVVQDPAAPGNVFTADEKDRKVKLRIVASRDGVKGKVAWKAVDLDGETVFDDDVKFDFAKAGDAKEVEIDLGDAEKPGLYLLPVSVLGADGEPLYTHEARFAILPKAGRAVKPKDSPYSTWWFGGHGSPGKPEIGGPLLKKAGIAKFSANYFRNTNDWVKYNCVNCGDLGGLPWNMPTNGEAVAKLAEKLQQQRARMPYVDHIKLWHESGPRCPFPEELLGLPVTKDADRRGPDTLWAKRVNDAGAFVRKYLPGVKLQIGNTTSSIGSTAVPLRGGAKPEYYDVVGIETPSQVIPPERLIDCSLQATVVCKDIGEYYCKRPVAASGCYEFTYRAERDMGEDLQACWYMRDILVSLAHGFFQIAPGIFIDTCDGYYGCFYGGSGIIFRAPYCYPKRSYVAYAALTYALDGVTEPKRLDTGSTTAYALAFRRADGRYATALWAARGEIDFEVDSPVRGTVVHFYGDESRLGRNGDMVRAGEHPAYLVTDEPVRSVRVAKRHAVRGDAIAACGKAVDVAGHGAYLEPDPQMESSHHDFLPILKRSDFTLAEVDDPEEGRCLEVKLDLAKNRGTSKYVTEYTTVRFREPIALEGDPSVIFARVRGDSNWGQIRFEIEDADGEVFKNISTGRDWACDVMDWPGNLAVNFDGWGWVWNGTRTNALMPDHSPGPWIEQWVSTGGDKKIRYPVKVRAVTVGVNRQKLDLTTFSPSAGVIRLKSVGGAQ